MQPSYLPWVGFFNLIMNADVFVFLDDVQYSKNTFFNRNRYPSNAPEGFSWLTVPVRRVSSSQLICETGLVEDGWRRKHLASLKQAYGKEPYFHELFPALERNIGDLGLDTLAKLNIALIRAICEYLGIQKTFHISSELKVEGERSDRLLKFCHMFDCPIYVSPGGAIDYITEDNVLPVSDVKVLFQKYEIKPYPQKGRESFLPAMSIIDLAFRFEPEEVKRIIYQEIKP